MVITKEYILGLASSSCSLNLFEEEKLNKQVWKLVVYLVCFLHNVYSCSLEEEHECFWKESIKKQCASS